MATIKENRSLLIKSKKYIHTKRMKLATQSLQIETKTTMAPISEDTMDDLRTKETVVSRFEVNDNNSNEAYCETNRLFEDPYIEKNILYEKFKSLEDELNSLRKMLEATEISTKKIESEVRADNITGIE